MQRRQDSSHLGQGLLRSVLATVCTHLQAIHQLENINNFCETTFDGVNWDFRHFIEILLVKEAFFKYFLVDLSHLATNIFLIFQLNQNWV